MRTNIGRRLEILCSLLDHETREGVGLGVSSAAEILGREKSQISRGLRALQEAGLVVRDDGSRDYVVAPRWLAYAAHAGDPRLLRSARPVLERLSAQAGERVQLAVLHRGRVLTLDTIPAVSPIQAVDWVGRLTALHLTAAGHALVMDHDAESLRAAVGPDPIDQTGRGEPATLAELMDRVTAVRALGLAVVEAELEADLVTMAAAVRDQDGEVVAAVGVAGPRFRLGRRVDEMGAGVRTAARALTDILVRQPSG